VHAAAGASFRRLSIALPVTALARVWKDPSDPELPIFYRAVLAREPSPGARVAFGKGLTVDAARMSALGEALEWHCAGSFDPSAFVRASRAALPGPSVDPRRLHPARPVDDDLVLDWVEAAAAVSGTRVLVPALAVHVGYEPPRAEERLFSPSSNGLGAGSTAAAAALRALLEVIERDAFFTAWLQRLAGEAVDLRRHPDPALRDMQAAFARRGVELGLWRLPTGLPVTVMAGLALADKPPAFALGLGAALSPADAARAALLEAAQIRTAVRMRLRRPEAWARAAALADDPGLVAGIDDHGLLWSQPAMRPRADFLRSGPPAAIDWEAPGVRPDELACALAATGREPLVVDLTTPDAAALGASVARAVVPDALPARFGAAQVRPPGLNPDPHPLG
jgi:ribosomal protein S12 methylthiotransferase accessory factor